MCEKKEYYTSPDTKVTHTTVNGKFSVRIEKAASANKSIGWKVEAANDDMVELLKDIRILAEAANGVAASVPL